MVRFGLGLDRAMAVRLLTLAALLSVPGSSGPHSRNEVHRTSVPSSTRFVTAAIPLSRVRASCRPNSRPSPAR